MPHTCFATQIQQCIAKPGFCVANCDAIPNKLCPVQLLQVHTKKKASGHNSSNTLEVHFDLQIHTHDDVVWSTPCRNADRRDELLCTSRIVLNGTSHVCIRQDKH